MNEVERSMLCPELLKSTAAQKQPSRYCSNLRFIERCKDRKRVCASCIQWNMCFYSVWCFVFFANILSLNINWETAGLGYFTGFCPMFFDESCQVFVDRGQTNTSDQIHKDLYCSRDSIMHSASICTCNLLLLKGAQKILH